MTFRNSHSTINDPKKTTSFMSITPRVILLKWVRKLIERSASTMISGAQPWKKLSTICAPDMVNRKHTVAPMMKAMTWFVVSAEMQALIERNAPAITRLPR